MNLQKSKLKQNKVKLELSVNWWNDPDIKLGLPKMLCADGEKGVTELIFRFKMSPGVYQFSFIHGLVDEPPDFSGQFWVVYFDGLEMGCGGIAPTLLAGERTVDRQTEEVRFVSWESGLHSLKLAIKNIDAYQDCAFDFHGVNLKKIDLPHPTYSLKGEHPGRAYIDVWGWMNCLDYQRTIKEVKPYEVITDEQREKDWKNSFAADIQYMMLNVVDESFRWGANGQEFYLSNYRQGNTSWPMPWSKEDPIKGAETYNYFNFPHFGERELKELCSYSHLRDSLFHWYGHIPERDAYKHNHNFIGPGRTSKWWLYNLQEKMSRDYANFLKDGWLKAIDGWAGEYMELLSQDPNGQDLIELTKRIWRYNPGAYMNDNVGNTWSRYVSAISPAFSHTLLSNARDDGDPLDLYGDEIAHGSYGKTYFNLQGDARVKSPSIFGGWIHPDFVVKECNDFFRVRAYNPEDIHTTAVWWLADNRDTCPDWVRRYVYAVSQDPLKCAATYQLSTLGKGGGLEQQAQKPKEFYPHTGLSKFQFRPRNERPCTTSLIQNNYMRAYFSADKDGGELFYDPEGLAHYDGNSLSTPLSKSFISVESEGGVSHFFKVREYLEPAGYKAVYQEKILIVGSNGEETKEERRYTLHNDTSYLKFSLKRSSSDKNIFTKIGCEGYDELEIEGRSYRTQLKQKPSQLIRFKDKSGLRPDWSILIKNPGNIEQMEWLPKKEIIFHSIDCSNEEIEIVFMVSALYQDGDVSALKSVVQEDEIEAVVSVSGIEIGNQLSLPRVAVVRIKDPTGTPYLAKENGWWMFRGAQPSKEVPDFDYLKVYLAANTTTKIQRYDFIENAVKMGWGCQYTMSLRDIKVKDTTVSCRAKVFSVTPLIFAPRLHYKEKIKWVTLDGRSWHYYHDHFVLLPNQEGIYEIEVGTSGTEIPHLSRTYALVEDTSWDGSRLRFKASLPQWCKKLHKDLKFTGAIATAGWEIERIEGGSVLESRNNGDIIEFKPGRVIMSMKKKAN